METGDVSDIKARIRALLPAGWFPDADQSPILESVITGPATGLAWAYSLLTFVKQQARIATATGGFADLVSFDYFGYGLLRFSGESDAAFSARIRAEILRERNTRHALSQVLIDLTGRTPIIHEGWEPGDNGAYDETSPTGNGSLGALAYDQGTGAWGEDASTVYVQPASAGAGHGQVSFEGQVFVTVFRPTDGRTYSDAMVYTAIERVRTAGTVIWAQITN